MPINTILLCAFSLLYIHPQQLCAMEIAPAASPFSDLPHDMQKTICLSLFSEENQKIVEPIFDEALKNPSTNKALADLFFKAKAPDIETTFIFHHITHPNMSEQKKLFCSAFKEFSITKQNKILDRLYEQKYDPEQSPLWKQVKEVSDEKDYKKRTHNLEEIYARIDTWSKEDPAAALYAQLIQSKYTSNQCRPYTATSFYELNQGLYVQIGHYSKEHEIQSKTSSRYKNCGRTELPLLLAISPYKGDFKVQFEFKDPISVFHDIDVAALKECEHKRTILKLDFGHPLDFECHDDYISPRITELNNTTIYIKGISSNALDSIPQLTRTLVIADNDRVHAEYFIPEDYWFSKAIAKIGCCIAAGYCFKKYILDEGYAYTTAHNVLSKQARQHAFDAEIKPLLTPEITETLQVLKSDGSLPALLSQEIGIAQDTITPHPTLLNHAQEIISKTKDIMKMDYPINEADIQTPYNIIPSIGNENHVFLATISALYLSVSLFKGHLAECANTIVWLPYHATTSLCALLSWAFKPDWLQYYVKTKLKIIKHS